MLFYYYITLAFSIGLIWGGYEIAKILKTKKNKYIVILISLLISLASFLFVQYGSADLSILSNSMLGIVLSVLIGGFIMGLRFFGLLFALGILFHILFTK